MQQRPHTSYRKYTIRAEQLSDHYDAVIIGAGVGGLTCGAYLAKFGAKVLIVDRHSLPGGLCSFFKRKGFYFDAGAHYFGSLGDRKSFGGMLLRPLDLDVEFIPMDPVDILHFPDRTIELPANIEAHTERIEAEFPHEAAHIRPFLKEMLRVYRHFFRGRHDSPLLERYSALSYQAVLDQYFSDPMLKAVFAATIGYMGVYPKQVSAIAMASMMMSYFYDGGYIARGGSQALPNSLMRRFAAAGGDLLLNTEVEQVVCDDNGRATHVRLASGRKISASVFVSNADARQTFSRFIDPRHLDGEFLGQLEEARESNSCFVLYLGLACDARQLEGKRGWHWGSNAMNCPDNIPLYLAIPTLEDPCLCPPGHHILTATTIYQDPPDSCPPDQWAAYKSRRETETLARLEQIIPGISRQIVVQESATRRTIYRFTRNANGAMYGWESSPDQYWLNRLDFRTPLDNLFLCGHWTSTGPGVLSVVASGFLVARTIAKDFSPILQSKQAVVA